MKIIISPSKEMLNKSFSITPSECIFKKEYQNIYNILTNLSIEEIENIYKISNKLALQVHSMFNNKTLNPAIYTYNGLVFRQLDIFNYNDDQLNFMQNNLTILSSMYGILKPFDNIYNYRLDQKTNINIDLYDYWNNHINQYYKDDNLILSLASNEYEGMVQHQNIVKVDFIEITDKGPKRSSAIIKKARGKMLDYIIKNKINDINSLKLYNIDYQYNHELSNDNKLVFIKKTTT